MAAPDWMFDRTAVVLTAVLPPLRRPAGGIADVAAHARYRRTLDRLLADTRSATRSATLGADMAEVVTGYRAASSDARSCIAGLTRVVVAARAVSVGHTPRTATERLAQQHELALTGLAEVLALAEIAASVARLTPDSHDEARRFRESLGRLFGVAIERAGERGDIHAAMALRATQGALARDLIERGRPLARIVAYDTGLPLPAVVLAHELYQDAGRADELIAENAARIEHPAFMPMHGRARSR